MLKPLVPKFCPDLYARLRDIAEKQAPVKLKQMVSEGSPTWIACPSPSLAEVGCWRGCGGRQHLRLTCHGTIGVVVGGSSVTETDTEVHAAQNAVASHM